ncbi:unnamed protein product [Prorocentrum cordatum]|uniref:Uncharacterized protein n=1 Tax=Prorocentrum cordatum TaxID=2364126 RepID=A0ABN9SF51_9DINO|nr:unnamed protein product [Polarella glacialis]
MKLLCSSGVVPHPGDVPTAHPRALQGGLPDVLGKVGADSLVTAVRAHRFLWEVDAETGEARAKNYDPQTRPRRQDWDGELVENGAFYLTTKAQFDATQCRLGGKMALYEMPEHTFVEIDSPTDWQILEGLAREHGYSPGAR